MIAGPIDFIFRDKPAQLQFDEDYTYMSLWVQGDNKSKWEYIGKYEYVKPKPINFTKISSSAPTLRIPDIKIYDPDKSHLKAKIGEYKFILRKFFPRIADRGTAIDLCCKRCNDEFSTAGAFLESGFIVYAFGNDTREMTGRKNLVTNYCRDVRDLLFIDSPSKASQGKYADVRSYDPCGFDSRDPDFIDKLVEHTKLVFWFVSNCSAQTMGYYSKYHPNLKFFGQQYPHGEGTTLNGALEIVTDHFKKMGMTVEIREAIGPNGSFGRVIGIYNPYIYLSRQLKEYSIGLRAIMDTKKTTPKFFRDSKTGRFIKSSS